MDFRFTETQQLFAGAVFELLEKECTPSSLRRMMTAQESSIKSLWGSLSNMGVIGMTGPESMGGLGMTDLDLVLLMEEMGKVACPETVIDQTCIAVPLLSNATGNKVDEELIKSLITGEKRVSTTLGTTYALAADSVDYLLLERNKEIHLVCAAEVEINLQDSVDETRRLFSVEWDPTEKTRINTEDTEVKRALMSATTATAAQCVGTAMHLLKTTVDYVKEREQFGKPVGTNQAIKHHLADTGKAIEFARPMVHRAAWALSVSDPSEQVAVSMAKYLSSKAVNHACRTALQCHGAIGYTMEYDLQIWLKRGWALAATRGDTGAHSTIIGKSILADEVE
ncbi:MAG: acyl-CoA dehydrogenase [Acidimicrobiaceae bacterium]|jgi:alkylation response protein AidB-like acyl-CoA dehydrogenase|nr:acyl-CoA dehydrogenase [Acidimicrobiaceae bacterium]|tara:strand:+ start:25796 stop:26812 length:1017 start_codon:yes stop_codon:yes gene_type:complete